MSELHPLVAQLRDIRIAQGMSIREMARRNGISPASLSRTERGDGTPSIATIDQRAQLLGYQLTLTPTIPTIIRITDDERESA